MIFLFILYSLFLHDHALGAPPPPLYPAPGISLYPREIDPNNFTQRSTWNIVCSCFATLFACSWVAVHPNIPAPSESIFHKRLMIMGWMLMAPELVIIWAGRQWLAARYIAAKHKSKGWTITHGFFASMGGFMLYKEGIMIEVLEIERLEKLENDGKIEWPSISERDIQDKSKGDAFSKGFVVLQTTWFIIQCISRGVVKLNLTELELATVAFAILNGIVYLLWWSKPLDVACPVPVPLLPSTSQMPRLASEQLHSQAGETPSNYVPRTTSDASSRLLSPPPSQHHSHFAQFRAYFCKELEQKGSFTVIYVFIIMPLRIILYSALSMINLHTIQDKSSVPTFYAPQTPRKGFTIFLGAGIGMLFGGIHCIAWSFFFQSVSEKYIWRISSVIITVIPITSLVTSSLVCAVIGEKNLFVWFNFQSPLIFLYCVSRVALLILPLVALRSLSAESLLEVKWSALMPHI